MLAGAGVEMKEEQRQSVLDIREKQSSQEGCGPHSLVQPLGQVHEGLEGLPLDVTIRGH